MLSAYCRYNLILTHLGTCQQITYNNETIQVEVEQSWPIYLTRLWGWASNNQISLDYGVFFSYPNWVIRDGHLAALIQTRGKNYCGLKSLHLSPSQIPRGSRFLGSVEQARAPAGTPSPDHMSSHRTCSWGHSLSTVKTTSGHLGIHVCTKPQEGFLQLTMVVTVTVMMKYWICLYNNHILSTTPSTWFISFNFEYGQLTSQWMNLNGNEKMWKKAAHCQ